MEVGCWLAGGKSCSSAMSAASRPCSRTCFSMASQYNGRAQGRSKGRCQVLGVRCQENRMRDDLRRQVSGNLLILFFLKPDTLDLKLGGCLVREPVQHRSHNFIVARYTYVARALIQRLGP